MSGHERLFGTDTGVVGTRDAFGEGLGLNVAQDLVRRGGGPVAHLVRVEEILSCNGLVCELRTNAGTFPVRVVCTEVDVVIVTTHGPLSWRAAMSIPESEDGMGAPKVVMPTLEQAAHAARTAGIFFDAGSVTVVVRDDDGP